MNRDVEGVENEKDTSKSSIKDRVIKAETPSQRDEKETIAALVGASIRLRLEKNYLLLLDNYFEGWKEQYSANVNEKKYRSAKKLLMSSDGRQIIELVWKESRHIPDMSLAISGYEKSILQYTPSITDIADAIVSDASFDEVSGFRTGNRIRQRVQRVVEAAEFFDLLTRPDAKGGCARPIQTTDDLHLLMKRVHHQNIAEIAQLFSWLR